MSTSTDLQNLHTIVLPPERGVWPPAPGWYLVAVVLVIFLSWLVFRSVQNRRTNRYRAEALRRLDFLRTGLQTGDKEPLLRQVPCLVKSTALAAYPRFQVAGLYGDEWLSFLDETIGSRDFREGAGRFLPQLSFGQPICLAELELMEIEQLLSLVEYWIRNHRVADVVINGQEPEHV